MEALHKLLTNELQDLYDAEHQILKALPKMIDECSSPELRRALQQHLTVTEKQVSRLDQVFRDVGGERARTRCKGMAGIIAEGEDLLKEDLEESTKDAGIIGAAQKVEHYEIATYGTARTLAEFLGNSRAAQLLKQTLEEEKEADKILTQLAEASVNVGAAEEEKEGEVERGADNGGRSRSRSRTQTTSKSRNRPRRRTRPRATR
ncbi:MAG: ferritin-like domain-containing protein [Gemmatimonadales bacterium]